jgi:hypothetical protein
MVKFYIKNKRLDIDFKSYIEEINLISTRLLLRLLKIRVFCCLHRLWIQTQC